MSANDYRATINMPQALRTDLREWSIEASRALGREVSFQDAVRAILAAGVGDPEAGQAAMDQLRQEVVSQ